MTFHPPDPRLFDRYLRALAVNRRKPSYDALCEVVAAHLTRVPFENISKLYYLRREGRRELPGLERYLDGIERYRFGGTCYPNNHYLNLLLAHLGYDARLCGADMNNPDVHLVNIVALDGREYLVDSGYAAPFLEPLPRDLKEDHEIALGRDRYVLKPQNGDGRSVMELYREGELKHGYTVKPTARTIDHFADVIAQSFTDKSTFMTAVLLVRIYPNRSVVIHNLTLIESEGAEWRSRQLAGHEELVAVVEEYFGIPAAITAEAIADLGELGDAWN